MSELASSASNTMSELASSASSTVSVFPRVERDEASAEFFDAAARGELLVQRAPGSGTVLAPGARVDPVSGSAELEPFAASGAGTLVSWAVVHHAPLPVLADAVPYVAAVVELAEGPWVFVRLLTDDPAVLRAGAPVRATYVRSGAEGGGAEDDGGEVVVAFEPV